MDYAYYATQTQSYQFNGFPPTPTHSYEPHDDQSADAPDLYQSSNGFTGFQDQYQFSADGFLPQEAPHIPTPQPPTHQQQQQQPSPNSTYQASVGSMSQHGDAINGVQQVTPIGADFDAADRQESRSDSEEKESAMTPQQSRRKAQNRAAQRAFRERKERHVKELETKLNSLSAHSSSLLSDNERLKRELQRLATQNEILKATTQQQQQQVEQVRQQHQQNQRSPSPVHGPQTYSPTDFSAAVGVDLHMHPLSYDKYDGDGGQRLLAAGAAWDFIQSHELFRRGQVDVADISRRLHGKAACNGRGPVFKENEVLKAIEESVLSSSDELI